MIESLQNHYFFHDEYTKKKKGLGNRWSPKSNLWEGYVDDKHTKKKIRNDEQ